MKNNLYGIVNEELNEAVNHVFLKLQNRYGIKYGDIEPLDDLALNDTLAELTNIVCRVLEYEMPTEPYIECFHTGGNIWVTVYQFIGDESDRYFGFDSTCDDCDGFIEFSHEGDYDDGYTDDWFSMYHIVRYVTLNDMTDEERIIFYKMKLYEAETLKKYYV